MRYVLDFGSANAGGSPAFTVFRNADTLANIAAPALTEVGSGLFYFDWDWASTTATSIVYQAVEDVVELSDVITSDAITTASGVGAGGAASTPWLDTAGQIINTVAVEVFGTETGDPYASTDANFIRLRTLLKASGRELVGARDWKVLVKGCTITGDGVTSTFNLPADFLRMVDDTGWNRGTKFPIGLVSSRGWQHLQARSLSGSVSTLYRIVQGQMQFYEAPAAAGVIGFDYVSLFWVKSDGAASADQYVPSASGDVVMLEPHLVSRALKVKFLDTTGQDSGAARQEYQAAFEAAAGTEPARTLSLNGGGGDPLLSSANLPATPWGQA
jgi:hypothetical protein